MPTRKTLVAALALSLASVGAAGAAQDEFQMKPSFSQGDEFVYQMAMRVGVSQTDGSAEAFDSSVVTSATVRISINSIESDGSARASLSFEHVNLEGEMNGKTAGYAWPMAEALPANAPKTARLGEVLCASDVQLYISPLGAVGVLEGLEDFVAAADKIGNGDSRLMGFFTPEKLGASLSPIFTADGGANQTRSANATWNSNDLIPLPPIGLMDVSSDFNIAAVNNGMVQYMGQTEFAFHASGSKHKGVAQIEVVDQSGQTTGSFNLEAGALESRASDSFIRTRWMLGNTTMEQTQSSTTSLVLVDFDLD